MKYVARKKRDRVCFLDEEAFRFQILSTLIRFDTTCFLQKPKLSFPKGILTFKYLYIILNTFKKSKA